MTEHFFETTAGIKIKIQPISMLDLQLAQTAVEKEFRARGESIEPPTYEVEVLGGEREHHPHTEKTIVDASEEEKAAWAKYIETVTRLQTEIQTRTALIFLEGIVFNLPADENWIARRKRLFGDEQIPEDEDGRKLFYVNNVLLKTPADKSGLMMLIQRLSLTGASEEAIEAMENLFRRQMAESNRAGLEVLKALAQEKAQNVVLQPDSTGQSGGQSVGVDAKPVQATQRRRPSRDHRH